MADDDEPAVGTGEIDAAVDEVGVDAATVELSRLRGRFDRIDVLACRSRRRGEDSSARLYFGS
jgi:hypothetical protein